MHDDKFFRKKILVTLAPGLFDRWHFQEYKLVLLMS